MALKYRQILEQTIANPQTPTEDRRISVTELKRREDTAATLWALTGMTAVALVIVVLAQVGLVSGRANELSKIQGVETATTTTQPVSTRSAAASTQPVQTESANNGHCTVASRVSASPFGAACSGVLWGFAWFASGCIGGFLFGIPKTEVIATTSAGAAKNAQGHLPRPVQLAVNTNLEQISDWLTKIIVGLGLIELRNIPGRLSRVAEYMARCDCTIACPPLAMTIVILFTAIGFLFGYLATRLFLAPAFAGADQVSAGHTTEEAKKRITELDPSSTRSAVASDAAAPEPAATKDGDVTSTAKAILAQPARENEAFEDRYARAKAKLVEARFNAAADDYATLVAEKPDELYLRLEYAWALQKSQGRFTPEVEKQLKEALRIGAKVGTEENRELYESLTFHYLYKTPNGFEQTIGYGEEYLINKKNLPSAGIHVNAACAFAARFREAKDDAQKNAAKEQALTHLRDAVAINENVKATIEYLLDKAHAPEDDLSVFSGDADFQALVK